MWMVLIEHEKQATLGAIGRPLGCPRQHAFVAPYRSAAPRRGPFMDRITESMLTEFSGESGISALDELAVRRERVASLVASERSLRGVAVGRKAWLFAGSDRGGERAAAMYSLIVTAKLNNVDPRAWLADALGRIADHPASRLSELLPWNRAKARELAAPAGAAR